MRPYAPTLVATLLAASLLAGCVGGGGDEEATRGTPAPGENGGFPAANDLLRLEVTAEPVEERPCVEEPASVVAHVTAGGEPQGGAEVEARYHLPDGRVVTQSATTDGTGNALVGQTLEGVEPGQEVRVEVVASIGEREDRAEVTLAPEAC